MYKLSHLIETFARLPMKAFPGEPLLSGDEYFVISAETLYLRPKGNFTFTGVAWLTNRRLIWKQTFTALSRFTPWRNMFPKNLEIDVNEIRSVSLVPKSILSRLVFWSLRTIEIQTMPGAIQRFSSANAAVWIEHIDSLITMSAEDGNDVR